MANYIIFFFLNVKVNNRTSRTLWRRHGHDDVHLRLLHPWGNHNFLCCAQVCFSSVSLEIFKSVSSISPQQCMANTICCGKQHRTSNSGDQSSQYILFTVQSGVSAAGHAHRDHLPCPSEQWKMSSGRLDWIWPSQNATGLQYNSSPTPSWNIFHWVQ